ncbi:MAG: hypothetical protein K5643_04980 [Saccharofermentans sp.]|nr:hypothetical protein [Saccharofermentans sp.]
MNKTLKTVLIVTALVSSGLAGAYTTVNAANVKDTPYGFYNTNLEGNTTSRIKENATKVYIHPISGPELKYTVQGYNGTQWNNRSSTHQLSNGTQASFTNFVYENGDPTARLHLKRTQYAYTTSYGEWSPDSTQNYTIYN